MSHAVENKHTGRCACGGVRFAFDTEPSFAPKLEMFVKRRLGWATPLGLREFTDMPR